MGTETWRALWLLLTAGLWGSGAVAQKASPSKPPPPPPVCQLDFLRSYMLKGYPVGNVKDTFAVCPGFNATCCNRRDQLYIYHYLNDVFPQQVSQMATKRNLLIGRLRRLHRRIMNTNLNWPGNSLRDRFCSDAGRQLYTFDFNGLYRAYIRINEEWTANVSERLNNFFCMICDANNHKFLDASPKATISALYCKGQLDQFKADIRFWSECLMDYLVRLQRVVDCNHYIDSYNLTFYNPVKITQAADVIKCVERLNEDFHIHCRRTCGRLSLAGLTDYMDGDLLFLEKTLNVFEKFNFHRESEQFVSMRRRRFNRQWQEFRTIDFKTSNGVFEKIIRNGTDPVDRVIDPVELLQQQLNIPIPRKLHLMTLDPGAFQKAPKERRTSLAAAWKRNMNDRPPTDYELRHRIPSNPQSVFLSPGLSPKTDGTLAEKLNTLEQFFHNGRRLMAQPAPSPPPPPPPPSPPSPPTTASTPASSIPPPKPRLPKISVQTEHLREYDSIFIPPRKPNEDTVVSVFLKPINIDGFTKGMAETGLNPSQYSLSVYVLEPFEFYQLVFNPRREDPFAMVIEEVVDALGEAEQTALAKVLDLRVDIAPANFFRPTIPDTNGDLYGRRRRKLGGGSN